MFYFDITELYQNLFITIYDEDENDADDFMGRLCIPILEMKQDTKLEYRLKTKQLDKFFQGSITITCSRYYNPIRGNLKLFKPMDEGKNYRLSPRVRQGPILDFPELIGQMSCRVFSSRNRYCLEIHYNVFFKPSGNYCPKFGEKYKHTNPKISFVCQKYPKLDFAHARMIIKRLMVDFSFLFFLFHFFDFFKR